MSKPIAIFYHTLFTLGGPELVLPAALHIIPEQMGWLANSGLMRACSHAVAGINGANESVGYANFIMPTKFNKHFHGLQCKNELRTIQLMELWLKEHPGWNVLYFHSKGVTHPIGHDMSTRWRNCMMRHLVGNWQNCVEKLDAGYDSVGCHWMMPPQTPPGQNIWGGNFFWATSDFMMRLPAIEKAQRISLSGIDSVDSRYEAEVWLGNGPTMPKIWDCHPGGIWQCP